MLVGWLVCRHKKACAFTARQMKCLDYTNFNFVKSYLIFNVKNETIALTSLIFSGSGTHLGPCFLTFLTFFEILGSIICRWPNFPTPDLPHLWRHQTLKLKYLENDKCYEEVWPLILTGILWRISWDTSHVI